jgi:hypothetical protein
MRKSIIVGFLLTVFFNLYGQNQPDSITVKNRLGPVFQQNGKNLTPGKLLTITKSNQEAYSEMKIANNNYLASMVFQLPGGFLIGYPIGAALAGGDPNWTLAAIGAGLVVVSIPFISAYNKHAKNAVSIFNKGLKYSSMVRPDFKLGITYNGIGIRISF